MKRVYLLGLSLLSVAVLFIGIPASSRAASNLQVSMYSDRGYHVTGDATTDDGGGVDYICVVCLNSDGSPNDVDVLSFTSPGPIDANGGCDSNFPTASQPYSVSVYDVTGPYSPEDSPGGLAYCQSFAPTSPSPSSGGSNSANAAPVPGPDMINLPSWAVVGTFTQTTPLYYAPASGATSDSTMNVGQSLWVLGLDETGAFYQVVLSGYYLWVPVGTIGPTYGEPWNGHPLPTEVVGAQ